MFRRDFSPSPHSCILCGRYTNERRIIGDVLKNQFFICHTCKKVYCGACMMQTVGISASKILRLAKKGRVLCPECGEFLLMAKNPQNIPFTQEPASKIDQSEAELYGETPQFSGKIKICSACGHEIREAAKFCDYCGAKQD